MKIYTVLKAHYSKKHADNYISIMLTNYPENGLYDCNSGRCRFEHFRKVYVQMGEILRARLIVRYTKEIGCGGRGPIIRSK